MKLVCSPLGKVSDLNFHYFHPDPNHLSILMTWCWSELFAHTSHMNFDITDMDIKHMAIEDIDVDMAIKIFGKIDIMDKDIKDLEVPYLKSRSSAAASLIARALPSP